MSGTAGWALAVADKPGPKIEVLNEEEVARALLEYPNILFRRLDTRLNNYLLEFTTRTLVQKRLSGRPGLNRQSGHLAGSFVHDVTGETLADLAWVAFTPVKYAWPHEPDASGRAKTYTSSLGKVWTMPPRLQFRRTYEEDAPRRGSLIATAVREAAADWNEQRGRA